MPLFSFLTGQSQAFAIDISDASLHLLEVKGSSKSPTIRSYKRMDVPEGIFERGIIKNQAAAVDAFRKLVAGATPKPPSIKRVVVALPEALTFLHHFSLPLDTDKNDLPDAILEQVGISMPFTIDEYAWDYQLLQKTADAYEVLFAAARADVVSAYEQTLTLAGLELVALEPESVSISRAIVPQLNVKNRLALLLDFGGRETNIILVDSAGIRLSVTRPEGGALLTQLIAKKAKLVEKTAEQRKCLKGLKDKALAPIIQQALEPILTECHDAIAYQHRLTGQVIGGVILVGGGSRLPGLVEYLHDALQLPVQLGSGNVTMKGVDPQDLVTISGLAIRASTLESGINFIVPAS